MRFGSVCSGIEAASVAWEPLGLEPAWYSEIDPFASGVLRVRHPNAPNLGDMTRLTRTKEFQHESIQLLVGGTPCQSFSVAGLRKGLDDPRGNLALVYLQLASRARPAWLVWENVPGVLSSNEGRDFGAFLGGLAELGYGFAYRVLDAQFFNLAQRRARVFVVGYLGDWRRAAQVLFERASLSGHPAPSRKAGQSVAGTIGAGAYERGWRGDLDTSGAFIPLTEIVSRCLTSRNARNDAETETLVCNTLTASHDASPDGQGQGQGFPIIAVNARQDPGCDEITGSLDRDGGSYAVALAENQRGELRTMDTASALGGLGGKVGQGYQAVKMKNRVRRLTPREWERLQGFPDDYTLIEWRGKPAPDSKRYAAIGNSMAVNVMAWIGRRILEVSAS